MLISSNSIGMKGTGSGRNVHLQQCGKYSEGSHIIGKVEGRQRKTGTDERKDLKVQEELQMNTLLRNIRMTIHLLVFSQTGRIILMLILVSIWGIVWKIYALLV